MRAIGVTQFGGPDALQVLDLPAEPLGAGQVRIRVTAAAVNPTDTLVRSGLNTPDDRPAGGVAVPGMDVADAAGAFGGYVVQLAKTDGLTVIADAAPADEALVRELGADIVVPRGEEVAARIREHYLDGVDGLADGALLDELALPAVRDGGAVATVRGYTGASKPAVPAAVSCSASPDHPRLPGPTPTRIVAVWAPTWAINTLVAEEAMVARCGVRRTRHPPRHRPFRG